MPCPSLRLGSGIFRSVGVIGSGCILAFSDVMALRHLMDGWKTGLVLTHLHQPLERGKQHPKPGHFSSM
jgi:hypothetical protein